MSSIKSIPNILACLSLAFSPATVCAQVSAASINGTARDSSGAIIPSVNILLRNTETSVETRTTTNEQGVYVLVHILPGTYTLEAGKEGFATSHLGPLTLVVNQRSVFDFQMAVGKVQESVTVEAVGAELQSATSELGSVLTRQQVINLPMGRSIQNLMRLTPGVNAITTGQSSIPSVNGQINRTSMYMLDGVNNQATFFSNLALNPIIETIEEFKVQSHNDSVEVGGVMGGVINTATRSGTNELHGNVYNIEQNDAFNARNTFLPSVAPFKGHTFGGTAGGPMLLPRLYNGRNRTFFFGGYQYFMSRSPALSYFRVPTEANLQGDLSDWPKQIYNPLSTRPNPAQAGTFVRDPFPQNQIPAAMLKPGMVYFARTVLPKPEYTGLADRNAINRAPNRSQVHSLNARVDHKFSDRDSIWVRYTGTYSPATVASSLPSLERSNNGRAHNLAGNWVHTFGPSAVLQIQFGRIYQWTSSRDKHRSLPSDFISKVGYSSNVITTYLDGNDYLPGFNPANFWSSQEQANLSRTGDSWHYRGGFSKLLGTHTLKFGGEYNRVQWYYENGITSIGFADAQTADPLRLATTGSSLASFLLDIPDAATRRDIIETMPWWGGAIGFYFQDSWKTTGNLTINLGLRYDRTFIPTAGTDGGNNNMVGNMDYNRGVYVIQKIAPPCDVAKKSPCVPAPAGAPPGWLPANVEVSPTGKVYTDTRKNFQPRLGFAYRMGRRSVIRGSSGIFFDSYSGVTQLARNFIGTWPSLGFQSAANLNYPTPAQVLPSISGANPLPSAVLPLANPFVQTAYFGDPNWKNAYSVQWNIGIQHQVTEGALFTLNYVGSGTHRTTVGGRYNVARTPGPGNFRDRSPFPYMPVPTSWDRSWGNANYHALQTSLERRWSRGVAFTVSYTYSKAIDPGSSGFFGVEGNSIQNPYDMHGDRSISSYDITHNLVMSFVYDLPLGKGKLLATGNRFADYVLGNWQVNGVSDIRSGVPVNVTVAGDIANTGNVGYMRPNLIGNWRVDNPAPTRWFDRTAFAAPAPFTFGNVGRNVLRADGVHRLDLSLFRNIPISERISGQLRVEAYNVFNVVTYNAPVAEFTNVNFGRVLSAMGARSLQIGARVYF
ncbi:MAG: TonB-dependent receptor [Acidobacteria bacterium]|nr:TonB-dependent receptor [Acidobacteriota bacterium]